MLQRSLEPVPATDGLIHLAYAAQMTNTLPTSLDIAGVAPVDSLADFSPTGRNHVVDAEGRDITGMVQLFDTSAAGGGALLVDGPETGSSAPGGFSMRVPGGNSGLMYFDVTYTDLAQIPRLLSHAITVAVPAGGANLPTPYAEAGYTTRGLLAASRFGSAAGRAWLAQRERLLLHDRHQRRRPSRQHISHQWRPAGI